MSHPKTPAKTLPKKKPVPASQHERAPPALAAFIWRPASWKIQIGAENELPKPQNILPKCAAEINEFLAKNAPKSMV